MANKCENCGGEGLIHQGDSIKYTCSACSGTGKEVVNMETEDVAVEEEVTVPEESFLGESSEVSSSEEV